jgi:hypothetical protein
MTAAAIEGARQPSAIAEFNQTASGIAELSARLKNVIHDVDTKDGMDAARKDRRECVTLRTSLESRRKDLKSGLLAQGKLLDGEAARIEAEILLLEKPIDDAIKAKEQQLADEKAERDRIERERVAEIRAAISRLVQRPIDAIGLNVAGLDNIIEKMTASPPTVEQFQELTVEAIAAYEHSLRQLRDARAKKAAQEEAAAQLKAGQEELARRQAAEDERQRIARDEAAAAQAAEAEEKRKQDSEREREAQLQAEITKMRLRPTAAIGKSYAEMSKLLELFHRDKLSSDPKMASAWREAHMQIELMMERQKVLEESEAKAKAERDEADRIAREAREEARREIAEKIRQLGTDAAMVTFMTAAGEYRAASDDDANERLVALCDIHSQQMMATASAQRKRGRTAKQSEAPEQ